MRAYRPPYQLILMAGFVIILIANGLWAIGSALGGAVCVLQLTDILEPETVPGPEMF